MTALLYKELRLSAHPTLYLFTLLGAWVLVPSYPYGMVFFFGCLGLYLSVLIARDRIFDTTMPDDTLSAICLFSDISDSRRQFSRNRGKCGLLRIWIFDLRRF